MSENTGNAKNDAKAWLPEPDRDNQPFFDGARQGKLRLQCCDECSGWMFPVKQRCQHCGSTQVSWRDASGRGTLYSHARLARVYHPRHEGNLPMLAQVDLEEGVRINSNLVGCAPGAAKVGMAVQVAFEPTPEGGAVPVFRLV